MTHSGYWAKQSHSRAVFDKSMSSTARDFRNLTPLVLMSALRKAGTAVHEQSDPARTDHDPLDRMEYLRRVQRQGGISVGD